MQISDAIRKHQLAIKQLKGNPGGIASDSSSVNDGASNDAAQMTKQLVQMAKTMEGRFCMFLS